MPQKLKKELIFGDFEYFRTNINTSLPDAKMIFFENFFLQKVTLMYDYIIVQKMRVLLEVHFYPFLGLFSRFKKAPLQAKQNNFWIFFVLKCH